MKEVSKPALRGSLPMLGQVLSGLFVGAMILIGAFFGCAWTDISITSIQPDPALPIIRNAIVGASLGAATIIGLQRCWAGQKYGYSILGAVAGLYAFLWWQSLPYR